MKKVLLINWDNYPNNATGGIYTWVKTLVDAMPDHEFIVLNEISNPNTNQEYTIPKNVTKIMNPPIYGSARYEEFCKRDGLLLARILRTTRQVMEEKFIPLYEEFINSVLSDRCNPKVLVDIVIKLHDLLTVYDAKKCLEHPLTWNIFIENLGKEPLYSNMTLNEVLIAYQMIQRNIQLLSIQVPKVDVIHCSLAWLPSLVAIYAKKESNCPLIVTEHGVAFRELVLLYNGYLYNEPSKLFWKVFSLNIIKTIYYAADLFTPVCHANRDWEISLGAGPPRVKVIYNGVDTSKFRPMEVKREDKRPTVVSVARVDAFKDIICLIQAIKYAREQIPDIQCLLYGTSINLEYSLRCLEAVKELHLEDTFKFMGGTKEPEKAYNAADVVAVSSITEGFPFTIIEAMACGKAVVASDVGGVREALEGCGLLVRSRRPRELAKSIVQLLKDENLRHKFETEALKKARAEFTLEKCVNQFRKEYQTLTEQHKKRYIRPSNMVLNENRPRYDENYKRLIKEHQPMITKPELNDDCANVGEAIMIMHHNLQPPAKNRKEAKENPTGKKIRKEVDSKESLFSLEKLKEYSDEELNKFYRQLLYRRDDQSQHVVLAIHAELRDRYEEIIKKEEEKNAHSKESLFSLEKLKEYSDEELNKFYRQLLYRRDDQSQHVVLAIHAELRDRYEEITRKKEGQVKIE